MTATRWVCVHGHFYQPPRENPWLDAIEPQPSAHPYPDWNARITAECYRPNAWARIVDHEGRIVQVVDNYARMSFNVGPTLLAWLEREAPDVHRALVAADAASVARFGHGSAMAQAYNHMIMPLASPRDRRTQVRWGVADFRHRFGRAPEGMWLPECAVDTASLEALAAEGIAFTVLAPHQAARVRLPGGPWHEVRDASVDPGRAYRCKLPSGRSIDLFFYDGPASRAIAFEHLLADGGALAARILARDGAPDAPLRHVATDGESYGHHHRYGDMALAWALETIDRGERPGVELVNYAAARARAPARWEVEIVEDSSWSCAHGVARWRDDCGCNSGGHPGWKQAWRRPLRDALDWLRDRAADVFERAGAAVLRDPWEARDAYVAVVLDRRDEAVDAFLAAHGAPGLDVAGRQRALDLLELQRHAMLMYTSCGWFFDDLSGIETIQILQYAARACELLERVGDETVEPELVDRLAAARSNLERHGDGRAVWATMVTPSRVDLPKVAAHWAVSAAIGMPAEAGAPALPAELGAVRRERVYCYDVVPRELTERRTGKARLIAATVRCSSRVTRETAELRVVALHFGEHHVVGGVRASVDDDAWAAAVERLNDAFLSADLLGAQRAIDRFFGGETFSLGSLFGRERDRALAHILDTSLDEAEGAFRRVHDQHAPLMRYLVKAGIPVPETLRAAGELVLRHRILAALRAEEPSFDEVRACIAEATQVKVNLDTPEVAYVAGQALARMIDRVLARDVAGDRGEAGDLAIAAFLDRLARMAEIAARMESRLDLWHAQNACVTLRDTRLPSWRRRAAGSAAAAQLVAAFARLCAAVQVYVG